MSTSSLTDSLLLALHVCISAKAHLGLASKTVCPRQSFVCFAGYVLTPIPVCILLSGCQASHADPALTTRIYEASERHASANAQRGKWPDASQAESVVADVLQLIGDSISVTKKTAILAVSALASCAGWVPRLQSFPPKALSPSPHHRQGRLRLCREGALVPKSWSGTLACLGAKKVQKQQT